MYSQFMMHGQKNIKLILSLLHGIAFILKRDPTAVQLISIKTDSISICPMKIVG